MITRSVRAAWVWPTIAACSVWLAAGCTKQSPTSRVPVVPVAGSIACNGDPTPGALVVFHPLQGDASQAPPARAIVRADGTFQLTTYEANDGAPPGQYKVTVEWRPLIEDRGDVRSGPNVLPERYSRPQSTDLVVHVAEDTQQLPPLTIER